MEIFATNDLIRVDYWVPALSKTLICCLIFKDGSVTLGKCAFKEKTSEEFSAAKKKAYEDAVKTWLKDHHE